MAFRFALVLLLLALAVVVESSASSDVIWGMGRTGGLTTGTGQKSQTCNGLVGECIDEEEEMMMDSESNRRSLRMRRRHISYGAMKKNQVPCRKRGKSYYGCGNASKVNPYSRGCSRITHCKRYLG